MEPGFHLPDNRRHILREIREGIVAAWNPLAFAMAALVHRDGAHSVRRHLPCRCIPGASGLPAAVEKYYRLPAFAPDVAGKPVAFGAFEFDLLRLGQSGFSFRNSNTRALNVRSPTESMWSLPSTANAMAFGMSSANRSGEPPISSLVPTAMSVGWLICATFSALSNSREVAMQAASAWRSLLVWSANLRNICPRASVTVPGSSADSAAAMTSQSPTPS